MNLREYDFWKKPRELPRLRSDSFRYRIDPSRPGPNGMGGYYGRYVRESWAGHARRDWDWIPLGAHPCSTSLPLPRGHVLPPPPGGMNPDGLWHLSYTYITRDGSRAGWSGFHYPNRGTVRRDMFALLEAGARVSVYGPDGFLKWGPSVFEGFPAKPYPPQYAGALV